MHTVKKSLMDSDGLPVSGASGWVAARDDRGMVFDFADASWKSEPPAQPHGELIESALVPGDYEFTFDESGWGTRTVTYLILVSADGVTAEAKEETRTFVNGVPAASSFTPVPPLGSVYLILYLIGRDGFAPSSPKGWATVLKGPPGFAWDAGPREGTWDPATKTLSWLVPAGAPLIHVAIPATGECSYWSTEGAVANIVLNESIPLTRL